MTTITQQMQEHLNNLTKPRGSLGKLEEYCLKMARIQNKVPPKVDKKGVYVFAGDHGIAEEGVSLYPQEVSTQMALNMLTGGAAINALSRGTNWELTVVDAGLAGAEFPSNNKLKLVCRFLQKRVMNGSRNFFKMSAMSQAETKTAIERGRELAAAGAERGYDMVAIGDLGIGNTATAAAMMLAAGFNADDVIDRGTGIDGATLKHKHEVITASVKRRIPATTSDGEQILREVGSPDFAMVSGFILGLGGSGIACVLDGFPVTAAAYIAYLYNSRVTDWLFAGHLSKVSGHKHILDTLSLAPVLCLDMHLGEGTGAALGGHIIELAVKTSREMASFASANITGAEIVKNESLY